MREALASEPLVDQDPPNYVIAVVGLPRDAGAPRDTTLRPKGKPAFRPIRVEPGEAVLFVFSKERPFTLEDQEVEFSTRIGPWGVKCKFRLKDLVYRGKLAL